MRAGAFGDFVYAEAQYYHDMDHFYASFQRSGGAEWRRVAGVPPMHYPTHSIGALANGGYDHRSMSPIMNAARLPKEFETIKASHRGVHKFLVDDFATSVDANKLPPVNAWAAARYNLPGLVAHESAMNGGEALAVPDYGDPPASWELLDPDGESGG